MFGLFLESISGKEGAAYLCLVVIVFLPSRWVWPGKLPFKSAVSLTMKGLAIIALGSVLSLLLPLKLRGLFIFLVSLIYVVFIVSQTVILNRRMKESTLYCEEK